MLHVLNYADLEMTTGSRGIVRTQGGDICIPHLHSATNLKYFYDFQKKDIPKFSVQIKSLEKEHTGN